MDRHPLEGLDRPGAGMASDRDAPGGCLTGCGVISLFVLIAAGSFILSVNQAEAEIRNWKSAHPMDGSPPPLRDHVPFVVAWCWVAVLFCLPIFVAWVWSLVSWMRRQR